MYNVCSISLTLTPSTISAFRLVHRVVEDTCIGAVPVDTVDINLLPLIVELFVKAPVIVSPAFFT